MSPASPTAARRPREAHPGHAGPSLSARGPGERGAPEGTSPAAGRAPEAVETPMRRAAAAATPAPTPPGAAAAPAAHAPPAPLVALQGELRGGVPLHLGDHAGPWRLSLTPREGALGLRHSPNVSQLTAAVDLRLTLGQTLPQALNLTAHAAQIDWAAETLQLTLSAPGPGTAAGRAAWGENARTLAAAAVLAVGGGGLALAAAGLDGLIKAAFSWHLWAPQLPSAPQLMAVARPLAQLVPLWATGGSTTLTLPLADLPLPLASWVAQSQAQAAAGVAATAARLAAVREDLGLAEVHLRAQLTPSPLPRLPAWAWVGEHLALRLDADEAGTTLTAALTPIGSGARGPGELALRLQLNAAGPAAEAGPEPEPTPPRAADPADGALAAQAVAALAALGGLRLAGTFRVTDAPRRLALEAPWGLPFAASTNAWGRTFQITTVPDPARPGAPPVLSVEPADARPVWMGLPMARWVIADRILPRLVRALGQDAPLSLAARLLGSQAAQAALDRAGTLPHLGPRFALGSLTLALGRLSGDDALAPWLQLRVHPTGWLLPAPAQAVFEGLRGERVSFGSLELRGLTSLVDAGVPLAQTQLVVRGLGDLKQILSLPLDGVLPLVRAATAPLPAPVAELWGLLGPQLAEGPARRAVEARLAVGGATAHAVWRHGS